MPLIDYIKRWRLERKGLSTGKKRKRLNEGSLRSNLDNSLPMKVTLFLIFSVSLFCLSLLMHKSEIRMGEMREIIVHSFFLSATSIAVFILNHFKKLPKSRFIFLTFFGILIQLGLVCLSYHLLDGHYALLCIPFALIPMTLSILLGRWSGIFSTVYVALSGTLLVPQDDLINFMILSLFAGLTGVYFTQSLKKRSQILIAGVFSGIAGIISVCALNLIPVIDLQNLEAILIDLGCILGMGIITGLFVGGIMPALEGLFKITTSMAWMEMSDLNHKLLRKMQLEAPGTFHHSMVVATLAEAAAESVKANAIMCRVCSYFHDIGKIEKAEYFIENQGEQNPHDDLTPNMSALVIISHVKDGVDLAVRHKLARPIIDVIKEHHGDSLVYYFYHRALERREKALAEVKEGLRNGEDVPEISKKGFRYPGPKPRTVESGIISLADSIESASRSLKKVTPQKIQTLIDEIVNNRIKDGQLDECPLTFQQLNTIKLTFAKTLRSMLHTRIDYPKDETKEKESREKAADIKKEAEVTSSRAIKNSQK